MIVIVQNGSLPNQALGHLDATSFGQHLN